jgi:hypothetical protein
MANPPYKQKMGEPPIFRFPPKSGGAKCNKNHAQIQQVGDLFLSDIPNWGTLLFYQASPCFAIRFAVRADGSRAATAIGQHGFELLPRIADERFPSPTQCSNVVRCDDALLRLRLLAHAFLTVPALVAAVATRCHHEAKIGDLYYLIPTR